MPLGERAVHFHLSFLSPFFFLGPPLKVLPGHSLPHYTHYTSICPSPPLPPGPPLRYF